MKKYVFYWLVDFVGTIVCVVLLCYQQWMWAAYLWLLTEHWATKRLLHIINEKLDES